VRATLATVPGVQKVDVTFESDLATIKYEKSRGEAAVAEMITALEGLGYKSWTVASEKKTAPAAVN